MTANHRCHVCGVSLVSDPWKSPLVFEYCPCCGVQFSYGDATTKAVKARRAEWIAAGFPWNNPALKPAGWSAQEQLARLEAQPIAYQAGCGPHRNDE